MNLRNLEKVLAREEEVKKRAIVHKAIYNGPQTQYFSKNGKLSLFLAEYLKQSLFNRILVLNYLHLSFFPFC